MQYLFLTIGRQAGRTALDMAGINGSTAIVSLLLDSAIEKKTLSEETADVNSQDQVCHVHQRCLTIADHTQAGVTVLHLASAYGQVQVVYRLLDDPYINIALCDHVRTALRIPPTSLTCEYQTNNTALHLASDLGHTVVVGILHARIDPNAANKVRY